MAKLIIDIINPTINLISRPRTESNKCEGTLEFTIKSTPNASITIAATLPEDKLLGDDLRELSYDLGSGYKTVNTTINNSSNYPNINNSYIKTKTITLNNKGEAKVRVILANSEQEGVYYTTNIFVKDNTNNKEETKEFTRYNDDVKCKIGEEPIANDDTYTVNSGVQSNLYILENDEKLHYIPDLNEVTITTPPSHGTLDFIFGFARYINNGDGATTDSFTYTVETPNGLSNEATVNINIGQESIEINNDTKVVIGFDNSGSMDDTLPVLQSMRDNELKTALLPYYDNETEYNNKVFVGNVGTDERFIRFMRENINESGNTIILIFQNEAYPNYETFLNYDPLRDPYDTDITSLNSYLDTYSFNFNAVIFQINSPDEIDFKTWLGFIMNGEGNYAGDKGFSQNDGVKVSYDVLEGNETGATGQYYADLIIDELNNLGFNL